MGRRSGDPGTGDECGKAGKPVGKNCEGSNGEYVTVQDSL